MDAIYHDSSLNRIHTKWIRVFRVQVQVYIRVHLIIGFTSLFYRKIFYLYLPISDIFGFSGIAEKVSSRFRIYIEYPPLEMD